MSFQRRQEFLAWLRNVERKWQNIWREKKVFEAKPDENRPKYFITVPYPYTNAPLHIGHGRTYTIGDIVARYKRLRGYNVLFPMAFHITGTPILAVSEMIARGDQKTIDSYRKYISYYVQDPVQVEKILESFKDPLNLAVFFAERVQADFEALGYSIDWRRKFHTGEPIYQRFITWQYLKLWEKNLITRGDHVVTYCLLHKQPEGEDDIQDADVNPVEVVEYVAVKFKLVDSDEYLLAATLRPETIYGVTNIWVKPSAKYVVFQWNRERYLISEKAFMKFQYQHPEEEIKITQIIEGKELIGKHVVSPFGKQVIILPAEFVDEENATGIVYSEPSDAPYDYVALIELKNKPELLKEYGIDQSIVNAIEPIKIIHVPGITGHHAQVVVERLGIKSQLDPRLEDVSREVYREQFYNGIMIVDDPDVKGLLVRDAREKIKDRLYSNGLAIPFYELNRKAWCRSGGEIIVAKIKGQWFLNYSLKWLKDLARKYLENNVIEVIPAKYKKMFLDTLNWLDKRPCARKRGIGTKLPWDEEWIIESLSDSTIYMAFYTIVHLIRENNINPSSLSPEVFDYVFLGIGDPAEISSKAGVPVEVLDKMRREFTYWYPVDHRHTAIPHISNHLSFFILHHISIFPEKYVPRKITLNETVIREGAKMSKSKGNVIPLRDIANLYSADLFRIYMAWAANLDSVLDWRETEVEKVIDSLMKFVNIAKQAIEVDELSTNQSQDIYTTWFIDKFYAKIKEATKAIEEMEIREYVQKAFFDVLSLIDKYKDMVGDKYVQGTRKILRDWITVLNPVIPHLTEEINSMLGYTDILSISKWPVIKEPVDEELDIIVDNVESVLNDLREIISLIKTTPRKAYIIVAPEWKREIARSIVQNTSLKVIIDIMRTSYGLKGREMEIVDTYNSLKKIDLTNILKTSSKREYEVYKHVVSYLKNKLGLDIEILWEDEARARNIPKAERALPLKPALFVI
ncbi:MAG: leucine--tRNA ligase [Desulfurococcaceae archaeon]